MVFKKSFTLLVATATTPFFAFVSMIIFEQDCSLLEKKKLKKITKTNSSIDIKNHDTTTKDILEAILTY